MEVTVSTSELYQLAKAMLNDGMDYVKVSILEADEEDQIPASLNFSASKRSASYESVGYGCLDDISSTL